MTSQRKKLGIRKPRSQGYSSYSRLANQSVPEAVEQVIVGMLVKLACILCGYMIFMQVSLVMLSTDPRLA